MQILTMEPEKKEQHEGDKTDVDTDPLAPAGHRWEKKAIAFPTSCAYCDHTIWTGLKRSAFQCTKCFNVWHKKCLQLGPLHWGPCKVPDSSTPSKSRKSNSKKSVAVVNNNNINSLFEAVVNDDLEQVETLLRTATEAHFNVKGKHGMTVLHYAVQSPNGKILMMLLARKEANITATNDNLDTPLHYFCQKYTAPNCTKPFRFFVARGANVNAANIHGETPLFKAIFNEGVRLLMVQMLLDNGAVVNETNVNGDTALHYAVRLGREDLVKVLLSYGADPNVKGQNNQTASDIAEEQADMFLLGYIKGIRDLVVWLKAIGMLKYRRLFILQDLNKAKIVQMDEKVLIERFNVLEQDDRVALVRAVRKLKNQKEKLQRADSYKEVQKLRRGSMSMGSRENNAVQVLRDQITEKDIIPHEEVEYTRFIAKGASAKVYEGIYNGEFVAIKVLRGRVDEQKVESFRKEFAIMSKINSEYVVKLFGLCLEPKLTLVMEFCSRGSLYDILNDELFPMGWDLMFKFAIDMTKGLKSLHSHEPKILHRDWKSLNLLVTEDWRIKICDFGLSRPDTNSNKDTLAKLRGTMAYCSPEVYNGALFNEKSDIYAIGVVLWELVNRCVKGVYQRPYSEYPFIVYEYQIVLQAAKAGLRPTIPTCPEPLAELLAQCWSYEPNNRPDASQLIATLESLKADFELHSDEWNKCLVSKSPRTTVDYLSLSDSSPDTGVSSSSATATTSSNTTSFTTSITNGNHRDTGSAPGSANHSRQNSIAYKHRRNNSSSVTFGNTSPTSPPQPSTANNINSSGYSAKTESNNRESNGRSSINSNYSSILNNNTQYSTTVVEQDHTINSIINTSPARRKKSNSTIGDYDERKLDKLTLSNS
jgi:hypothetical protein